MAKGRYSRKGSKRVKSRRSRTRTTHGKKTRHTRRHHSRRRMRRGGYTPGAPEIFWPLRSNQLLPGVTPYQRGGSHCHTGGVLQPSGSRMLIGSGNGQMATFGAACGRM
jgi:hypothetical protein